MPPVPGNKNKRAALRYESQGFTLIETLIVLVIVGILMSVGVPAYERYQRNSRMALAIADIRLIETAISRFEVREYALPNTLADAGIDHLRDPWGNEYQYLRIEGAGLVGKGALRKDKSLNPVNSDYDLYSMGEDGRSQTPFTAEASLDDIVRAGNGAFLGRAEDF